MAYLFNNDRGKFFLGIIVVSLSSSDWSNNSQTVVATGVTSTNSVIISPSPTSYNDYINAGIRCVEQGVNSLVFSCMTEPSTSISVNVMIFG